MRTRLNTAGLLFLIPGDVTLNIHKGYSDGLLLLGLQRQATDAVASIANYHLDRQTPTDRCHMARFQPRFTAKTGQ